LRANHRGVQVVIDPPDIPLPRRALRGLCVDLNQLAVRYPRYQISPSCTTSKCIIPRPLREPRCHDL
jgi:hypothetical protein